MASAHSTESLVGRTFGSWTVIGPGESRDGHHGTLRCRCACGTVKDVRKSRLLSGGSTHCHGCTNRTHGEAGKSSEYAIWVSMIARCCNPKNNAYPRYGGRGITVCERWRSSFKMFLQDMGRRPAGKSLDRFPDKNGNYEPDNCRWATSTQQNRNRRDNRMLTAFGLTLCVAEWAERLGVDRTLIKDRLRRGWTAERALSEGKKR